MPKNKQAFTLVELIVVITILAILGTIAFLSFQGYSKSARDSRRISDVNNIKTSLELYILNTGKYPLPDIATDTIEDGEASYSGEIVWTQGTIGDNVTTNLSKNLKTKPLDPLLNTEYTYSVSNTQKEYEIMSLYEGQLSYNNTNLINTSYASSTYNVKVEGTYNGVVAKTTNYLIPIPSIITSETLPFDLNVNSGAINSMVVTNGINIPDMGVGGVTTQTGQLDIILSPIGTINKNSTDAEKIAVIEAIQAAYTGSSLANESIYKNILSKTSREDKISLTSFIILNKAAPTPTQQIITYSNCTETIYSGYTITSLLHTQTGSFNKTVTNGTADMQVTCTDGILLYGTENINCASNYVLQNGTCVADICTGSAPDFSISTGTQKLSTSWTHNNTPGFCTFICQAGYYWNNTTCAPASLGHYVTSSGSTNQTSTTTGQYQDQTGQTTYKDCTNKPENSTYDSSTSFTTSNCPYSCDSGYYGSNCLQYVNGSCNGRPTNSVYYGSNSSYSLTNAPNGTSLTASYNSTPTINTCQYSCIGGYTGTSCNVAPLYMEGPDSGSTRFEFDLSAVPGGNTSGGTSVVIDKLTGLSWASTSDRNICKTYDNATYVIDGGTSDDGINNDDCNWESAIAYCANLELGGYLDWRLPDITELHSIVNYSRINPSMDMDYFAATNSNHWSSTTYSTTNYAYALNYGNSIISRGNLKTTSNYVRCVR